jgi:hypothetical protein
MIELQKDNLNHLNLLSTIKDLDENLQASFSGISQYFEGLARFDEGIAAADVAFIQGELDKYTTSLATVETKLEGDMRKAMNFMIGVLTANLAEHIAATLAILIATNCNPLKLIFNGPDLKDIAEKAAEIANAGAKFTKGIALITGFSYHTSGGFGTL